MVDHIRTLLVNGTGSGYSPVSDEPSDRALTLFGLTGVPETDAAIVDVILPLALTPDLSWFSSRFDPRQTPPVKASVYRTDYTTSASFDGLYDRVLGPEGRWVVLSVFSASDPSIRAELARLRASFLSLDGPYALGAVLLACSYRRDILRKGGQL